MRNIHGWRTRTAEGEKREVRAHLFGRRWTFQAKVAGEDEWTSYEEPLLEDLLELREVLFNKYQRKHLALEHLTSVEALILERGASWEEE
jgi:hypothetical protein